jgi:ABC-type Fe3+-siderophore transport system permease subunit
VLNEGSATGGRWLLPTAVAVAFASLAFGVAIRAPEAAGFGLMLDINGPRMLLAAAVGIGLAVSATVADPGAPSLRREVLLLAASFGGVAGGMRALSLDWFGSFGDFALGSLLGAAAACGTLLLLLRVRPVANWLVGFASLGLLAAAIVAAVAAKGNPDGLRPLAWWMLGDFSRVSWLGAAATFGVVSVGVAALIRSPARQSVLGLLLWGVAIGAGGVIAWFGVLAAAASRALAGEVGRTTRIAVAAALGATAMIWADALPRLLIGGYAFPVGVAVALVAIPWSVAWGAGAREHGRVLRGLDYVLAGGVGVVLLLSVGFLSYVVMQVG